MKFCVLQVAEYSWVSCRPPQARLCCSYGHTYSYRYRYRYSYRCTVKQCDVLTVYSVLLKSVRRCVTECAICSLVFFFLRLSQSTCLSYAVCHILSVICCLSYAVCHIPPIRKVSLFVGFWALLLSELYVKTQSVPRSEHSISLL